MDKQSDPSIPRDVVRFIWPILYITYYVSEINEEKKNFARFLRPEYLARVVEDEKDDFIRALSWAVEHPDRAYNKVLPDVGFSNEDCLKLMGILLAHIRAL